MAPLAAAYSGPPKFTLARSFTEWRADVPMLALILALAVWYLLSVAAVRQRGGRWGLGRTLTFIVLGLGFWAHPTPACPGFYEGAGFYARAPQTVLLVLVSQLYLALAELLHLLLQTS